MGGLKVKLVQMGNSHGVLIPKVFQKIMGIDADPMSVRFKITTDGYSLVLRRLKDGKTKKHRGSSR